MKPLYLCFLSVLTNNGAALAGCLANNCLRAVRASKSETQRQSDCVSYLHTTVTPPKVTHTSTLSFTSTSTVLSTTVIFQTSLATLTDTKSATLTETFYSTIISTISFTSTSTTQATSIITLAYTQTITQPSTSTITSTIPGAATLKKVKKRIVTDSGVPAYASPCSNLAAYISACSCQGVTPSTSTVPAPSTTITVSSTTTIPVTNPVTVTSTTTNTDATETTTITVVTASVTLPTTVSTSYTQWLTETATTTLITSSTTTITFTSVVATATAVAPFYLQISGGTYNGRWIAADLYMGVAYFTTSMSTASLWTIDGNGFMFSSGQYSYASINPLFGTDYVWLASLSSAQADGGIMVCSIGSGFVLACTARNSGYNTFAHCADTNNNNRDTLCIGTSAAVSGGTIGEVGVTVKAIGSNS
ncbi:hypothetical protein TWF694_002610 [Orbilia ellipsospora]|uniref:Antifreeze glycoprotein n=1 Tax=Orbilia ellipsospora TaxID=2528407 RepID=A0AAV9X2H2_9PEZI